jgi:hypothetical protein
LFLGVAFASGNAAVNGNGSHGGSNSTGVSGRPNMPLGVSGMVDSRGGNAPVNGNGSHGGSNSTGVSGRPNMPLGVSGMVESRGGNAPSPAEKPGAPRCSKWSFESTSFLASSSSSPTIGSSDGWPPGRVSSDVAITGIGLSR